MTEVLERPPNKPLQPLPHSALNWSTELQLAASAYLCAHGLEGADILPVDVVLMLLRIDSKEALERAQELTGKPITKCPSGVPPWPPKPVQRAPRAPRLCHLKPNPCTPSTAMHGRYALVRLGMTKEAMLTRGVTERDIRYWTKNGHIKFSEGVPAHGEA